jgi:hypothetical protein
VRRRLQPSSSTRLVAPHERRAGPAHRPSGCRGGSTGTPSARTTVHGVVPSGIRSRSTRGAPEDVTCGSTRRASNLRSGAADTQESVVARSSDAGCFALPDRMTATSLSRKVIVTPTAAPSSVAAARARRSAAPGPQSCARARNGRGAMTVRDRSQSRLAGAFGTSATSSPGALSKPTPRHSPGGNTRTTTGSRRKAHSTSRPQRGTTHRTEAHAGGARNCLAGLSLRARPGCEVPG